MSDIHVDFEWKSPVEIRRGPEMYFGVPASQPLMCSFAADGDATISRWLPGQPCPQRIVDHARSGGRFVAHNAGGFERHAWKVMVRDHGWPEVRLEQWRCTMASACAMGLPADLETLGEALGLVQQKDKRGKALIKFFCVPRADGEFNAPQDFPEKFAIFQDYCDQDVRTEMAVDARLVPLSDAEQAVWEMDQRINDRGVRVDRASAFKALELIAKSKALSDRRIREATGGAVQTCGQRDRLLNWITAQGAHLDGVAKDDILEAFDLDDLPDNVRRALEIRQPGAKTSIAKIGKLIYFSEGSGRVKNRVRYHGAGPGRFCLTEGTMVDVKTHDGVITQRPIQKVRRSDLVWDGDEWVKHQGVVFSGEKDVIEHDGVVASREHIVYIENDVKIPLLRAKNSGLRIYEKKPKI